MRLSGMFKKDGVKPYNMPKLKHEKFEADRDGICPYRSEIQKEECVCDRWDRSIHTSGSYQDIDFDAKSDKEIADAGENLVACKFIFSMDRKRIFPVNQKKLNYKPASYLKKYDHPYYHYHCAGSRPGISPRFMAKIHSNIFGHSENLAKELNNNQ